MKATLLAIYAIAAKFGGFGMILLGVLDSSFLLFLPLGNDVLMLGLTAQPHDRLLFYAAMATLGSGLGCFLTDALARKGGEEGLGRLLPAKRIEYVKRKMHKKAGWAIATSALMPPPFPFTAFVAASAALQYPRKKLLAILMASRFVRFCAIGLLAVFFEKRILQLANTPVVEYVLLGIVALWIIGSVISLYKWIQRSRTVERRTATA
jgi:membrane protein YqaA with SNARE-associated domain